MRQVSHRGGHFDVGYLAAHDRHRRAAGPAASAEVSDVVHMVPM
jgi:hypothetical protein